MEFKNWNMHTYLSPDQEVMQIISILQLKTNAYWGLCCIISPRQQKLSLPKVKKAFKTANDFQMFIFCLFVFFSLSLRKWMKLINLKNSGMNEAEMRMKPCLCNMMAAASVICTQLLHCVFLVHLDTVLLPQKKKSYILPHNNSFFLSPSSFSNNTQQMKVSAVETLYCFPNFSNPCTQAVRDWITRWKVALPRCNLNCLLIINS